MGGATNIYDGNEAAYMGQIRASKLALKIQLKMRN